MSRARASALILVNWKGVFFERYMLDRHVTALEGANGAGKTTVMIAAYVVLLPDLTRLKFTNLGETGATGGDRGIYGRLGEPGPSYAALEIEIEKGRRLCAGIYLERKSAPSLSLTPFIISDLPEGVPAHRIFLRQSESHEHVATMADIEESVAQAGARIEVFASAKEYFASLFECGVSPLRLSLDEERNKFNDMLRTSMTGGISRTLTSDLRSFLFKQQTGLFDTLTRMRKNLEACRRTRIEVSEARVLEQEINGIYTAGHAMFEAARGASERQATERRESAERARATLHEVRAQLAELGTLLREAESRKESLEPRVERARKAESTARQRLLEATRALAAAERLRQIEVERERVAPTVEAALGAQSEAASAREQAKAQRDAAQQTLLRAAGGLASLQAGLEELHRQAHAHRQVRGALDTAREALLEVEERRAALGLPEPETGSWLANFARTLGVPVNGAELDASGIHPLTPELLADAGRRIENALGELDRTRAERDRQARVAEQRRQDHTAARAALAFLSGDPGEQELALRARRELGRCSELELLGSRHGELSRESQRLRQLLERQRAVRDEVTALGLPATATAVDFVRHLADVETALSRASQAQQEHEANARQLGERAAALRSEQQLHRARRETHTRLIATEERLAATGLTPPQSRADLSAALRASHDGNLALSTRANELERERKQAIEEAQKLETMDGGLPLELVRLAELVDGQLLAARYEDLEPDEARRVQAELGPLITAIVVEDLGRAVPLLINEPSEQGDIWLIEGGAPWPAAPLSSERARLWANAATESVSTPADAEAGPPPVVVDLGHGVRISRLPREVTLGRAARVRLAEKARENAEAARLALSSIESRRREQATVIGDLEVLREHWDVWAEGDPGVTIERLEAELEAVGAERDAQLGLARDARVEIARLGAGRDALRAQLADHHLLDPPDYAAEADRARALFQRSKDAAGELERVKDARRVLTSLVHELTEAPPESDTLLGWERERPALEAQRDRLFQAAEALSLVSSRRTALGWTHAESALESRTELVPELEAQHARALDAANTTQLGLERAEARWEQATRDGQRAAAQLLAIDAHRARAQGELNALTLAEISPDAVNDAQSELGKQAANLEKLQREESGFDAELALARERLGEAEKRHRAAEAHAEREAAASAPSQAAWQALARAVKEAALGEPDADRAELTRAADGGDALSTQRWLEAEGKQELLADRLAGARGGAALAERVRQRRESNAFSDPMRDAGHHYLELWLELRAWLLCRLPAQIAELGEPLLGLSRLRDDLVELETRLGRQEGELRGTSADVARSIDVQLRRAAAQVKRLNRALEGVRFGSIHGIRVQHSRVEKMEQVLRALREGDTQELLFQSNLPIEEALDEIFRRHAGGRTGGQKLVDYREYLDLSVQIQRRTSQDWERVNPSQVSTGEAIGIGAALMMVILSEWERDDQILRQKRPFGSLRFLFLDEANRLSQDNLGVLFDLCGLLDLQLLIAAPEVARAEGNTTYRLVRRVSEDGQEEVLVTGRRASLPEATSDAPQTHDVEPHGALLSLEALPEAPSPEAPSPEALPFEPELAIPEPGSLEPSADESEAAEASREAQRPSTGAQLGLLD